MPNSLNLKTHLNASIELISAVYEHSDIKIETSEKCRKFKTQKEFENFFGFCIKNFDPEKCYPLSLGF